MLSSKAALGAGSIVVDSKLYGLYNLLRKGARGSRLFSLVLPKQDVVGSNPITRSTKLGDDLPRPKIENPGPTANER